MLKKENQEMGKLVELKTRREEFGKRIRTNRVG